MLYESIVAISTANGKGGVGIIRLSGDDSKNIAEIVTKQSLPKPRFATFRHFYQIENSVNNPSSVEIDSGILIYFCAPKSFTGEDVVEMQIHGSPVALSMLLQSCINAGASLAVPGEFSKRAFVNGKLDLAQAEAISDIIESSSSAAVIGANASLRGEFSQKIKLITDELIELRSLVEAGLDFVDEDIEFVDKNLLQSKVHQTLTYLKSLSQQTNNGVILREGIKVVIAGAPNAGKSSLLNSLVGEEVAIVTDFAGTTRDTIVQTILIEGIAFHIVDTAGIRSTDNPIEKIGIERAKEAINSADIVMHIRCFNEDGQISVDDENTAKLLEYAFVNANNKSQIEIINKSDLQNHKDITNKTALLVSVKNKFGLDEIKKTLVEKSGFIKNIDSEQNVFIARSRHLVAVNLALTYLQNLTDLFNQNQSVAEEIIAEELRLAHNALQEITGEYLADDLLGEIFGKFCIGK